MQDLREKEYLWYRQLAKKEAEVAKPKAPVTEKKDVKPKNGKTKDTTPSKATEQVDKKTNTKPKEESKKVVVKEEPVTNSNEDVPVLVKVSNKEPIPAENLTEVKEEVVPATTPAKEEATVNKVELETDNIESTLLAKVMIVVGAVLVTVGTVAARKIRKKS